ncbi:MAG: hypothetical protein QOD72_648 [Acidimicrobiaceae bacterium]|nr:hypothetical protein [Acidimicrobiaceae bacterium]
MVAITTASPPLTRFPSRPVLVVLPPVTRPGARIYRRRRLAVLLAVVAPMLIAAVLTSSSPASTAQQVRGGEGSTQLASSTLTASGGRVPSTAGDETHASLYVVQPGDTIWSIARKLDPSGDPRALVDRIASLNRGAALQPGQRLRLTDS